MKEAVLGLGANLGDRADNLNRALEAIALLPDTRVERVSSFIESEPFEAEGPDYINCCAVVQTGLTPEMLLGGCLGIEAAMGRVRTADKGPRVIDIDLLLYEGVQMDTPHLTLPHPEMMRRAFVLEPLRELRVCAEGAIDN